MSYSGSANIAKFYVAEPESHAVRQLAESLGRIHCSAFGRIEVTSVFHRKWREGTFTEREFSEVFAQFTDDCSAGLGAWLPVTDSLIATTAETVRTMSKRITIRSADTLHLVCSGFIPMTGICCWRPQHLALRQ